MGCDVGVKSQKKKKKTEANRGGAIYQTTTNLFIWTLYNCKHIHVLLECIQNQLILVNDKRWVFQNKL